MEYEIIALNWIISNWKWPKPGHQEVVSKTSLQGQKACLRALTGENVPKLLHVSSHGVENVQKWVIMTCKSHHVILLMKSSNDSLFPNLQDTNGLFEWLTRPFVIKHLLPPWCHFLLNFRFDIYNHPRISGSPSHLCFCKHSFLYQERALFPPNL